MNSAIEVTNLCKDYEGFSLKDVSFSLPAGYIMGFVGRNGAGKTTTIRLILNMTDRAGGDIKVFGMDSALDELKIKQDVGVVLDDVYFVDNWTVRQVGEALKPFYVNWSNLLYSQYLKDFQLPPGRRVKELSRGMKMKLMLAVAMSHKAKLLILDEPTSGLDPVARDELLDILSEYISSGDKTILFSTHITSDLEKIADYITLIDNGRIFYTGTKDDLIQNFVIVKGGPDDLTGGLRQSAVGLSVNRNGFSGLLPASEAKRLPSGVITEAPTIDEILVYISKGDRTHA